MVHWRQSYHEVGVDDKLAKQVRRIGNELFASMSTSDNEQRLGGTAGSLRVELEPVERLLKQVWRWKCSIVARAQLGLPPEMID